MLQETIRAEDVICRWGGEEFLLALPNTDSSEAEGIVHRLMTRLRS
jgi:diguanylate cyclase (GGDEF)-like protein